ncbi:hypothetical protein CAG69_02245 [Vibrio sp. V43_P6S15P86]|uniref:hypothetical protein n=1 Tax=Vibrio sp. V43_P6S15P86 TaxID=1938694 RepID=UPI0013731AD8|nr:hypothetical protein [Vibrio sp. V43_P6S15P86]NAW80889.1 hypothetical protein [Vibrio sp. V43_P6S15P86]
MGFFFKSWKEKNLKIICKHYPFYKGICSDLLLSEFAVSGLKERKKIREGSRKEKACLAYLIGNIDGFVRKAIDISTVDEDTRLHLVLTGYGYLMVEKDEITSDDEWVSTLTELREMLLGNEYSSFVKLGIVSVLDPFEIEKQENWSQFEYELERL